MLSLLVFAAAQAAPADCAERVLDYRTWREAPDQQWDFRWPSEGDAALTLIGAVHSRETADPQFARIAAAFAASRPTVALFEGPDRGAAASAEETIRTRGESGYLRFLAGQAGIPARSLEPAPPQQIGALLREFPLDQVLLFFTLRETVRLREREQLSGAALDAAVAALLQRMQPLAASAGLALPFADILGLEAAAARYWPRRDWRALPADWFSPLADDAQTGGVFLGAINRADSTNRNRHMVRLLAEAVAAGERPFAVIGRNHVPMQAPALACALAAAR
jgi:hypothetical protein